MRRLASQAALATGILLLTAVTPAVRGAGDQSRSPDDGSVAALPLVVSLSSPPSEGSEHDISRPLLLSVAISNPRAGAVRNRNAMMERERERRAKSGELDKMTAAAREAFDRMYSAAPVIAATVGSQTEPLWSLIAFEFVHESAGRLAPPVRTLAVTKEGPASVRLEGSSGPRLAFGIDAAVLAGVPAGRIEIRATLRTTGRQAMWQGEASSEALTIRIASTPSDLSPAASDERDYQEGRFHLLDRQFERARSIGERLRARSPGSVAAFELLGDAYDGLGRLDDAEQAFSDGIDAFRRQLAATPTVASAPDADVPSYFLARLSDVRARLRKGP
jgi:hypothetical protein